MPCGTSKLPPATVAGRERIGIAVHEEDVARTPLEATQPPNRVVVVRVCGVVRHELDGGVDTHLLSADAHRSRPSNGVAVAQSADQSLTESAGALVANEDDGALTRRQPMLQVLNDATARRHAARSDDDDRLVLRLQQRYRLLPVVTERLVRCRERVDVRVHERTGLTVERLLVLAVHSRRADRHRAVDEHRP